MKKTTVLSFILIAFFVSRILPVQAQDSTESAEQEQTDSIRIQELKDKVAQKVAQLRIVQKYVYKGTIQNIEDENITIKDPTGQEKILQVNNDTLYYWINTDNKKLKLTIKDFIKNDFITAWGEINKSSQVMKAEVISGRNPQYSFFCLFEKIDEINEILTCTNSSNNVKDELVYTDNTELKVYGKNKNVFEDMDILGLRKGEIIMVKGYKKNVDDVKINLDLVLNFGLPVPTPGK